MSVIYEIRRENLRTLIKDRGNGEVAKAAGYATASYLSQMVGPKAIREVTEKSARRIEDALGLPKYWLDQQRDPYGNVVLHDDKKKTPPPVEEAVPLAVLDQDHFTTCAVIVSNTMVALGVTLPTKKFTTIVTALLDQADQSEPALERTAKVLVSLAA